MIDIDVVPDHLNRITTKAPYQINNSAAAPSMSGDNKSWLGLAAQSP